MLPSTPFESPPDPPVPIRLYVPVTVPPSVLMSLAAPLEVFPATIVSVSVAVPLKLTSPPRVRRSRVAVDGAARRSSPWQSCLRRRRRPRSFR